MILFLDIRAFIRLSKILKHKINLSINTQVLSSKQNINQRILAIFQTIDNLGNYTNIHWFSSLDRLLIVKYIRELYDIWSYRADLSLAIKQEICPPNGDPFRNTNINLLNNLTLENLQHFTLTIIENLVNTGINEESKKLGAYYVLCSLTLVNHEAAIALPWLYQAVAHI